MESLGIECPVTDGGPPTLVASGEIRLVNQAAVVFDQHRVRVWKSSGFNRRGKLFQCGRLKLSLQRERSLPVVSANTPVGLLATNAKYRQQKAG